MTRPTESNFRLDGRLGIGGSMFDADRFRDPLDSSSTYTFKHTYPSTEAGLEAGYHIGGRVTAHVGSDVAWAFTKKNETQSFGVLSPGKILPFRKAWTAPITAGVTVRI